MDAPRAALLPLLYDVAELKRVRPAPTGRSLAEIAFRRAWGALASGIGSESVAHGELRRALVATRLAGADVDLLAGAGLPPAAAHEVCDAALGAALLRCGSWAPSLADRVDAGCGVDLLAEHPAVTPTFVELLAVQPRSPATRADQPRLTVEPVESHAEHCFVVAAIATVLAIVEGARVDVVFLAAMSHHLHNAWLPDGGFAGEEALGPHLATVVDGLRRRALAELPTDLAAAIDEASEASIDDSTAEGRALHGADVIDRVLQTRHHAAAAAFTVEQAMEQYGLVHEGPLQQHHQRVLAEVGL